MVGLPPVISVPRANGSRRANVDMGTTPQAAAAPAISSPGPAVTVPPASTNVVGNESVGRGGHIGAVGVITAIVVYAAGVLSRSRAFRDK
jgi:hypothetical protein